MIPTLAMAKKGLGSSPAHVPKDVLTTQTGRSYMPNGGDGGDISPQKLGIYDLSNRLNGTSNEYSGDAVDIRPTN